MVQTYTNETPIDAFRKDFLFRGAVCRALLAKHPGLQAVVEECEAIVEAIDLRIVGVQAAEDAVVVAMALLVAEKVDVIDSYRVLRLTFKAYDPENLFAFLPASPSRIAGAGPKTARDRVREAIGLLEALPEEHAVRGELLGALKQEFVEYEEAVVAGDEVRLKLKGVQLALMTYKSELSQTREAELGDIQSVLKSKDKTSMFTLPWRGRSAGKVKGDEAAISLDPSESGEGPPPAQ